MSVSKKFVFIFPLASGHINPSFPIARSLVELGHEVHYLGVQQMRAAIEGTGAVYHSMIEHLSEFFTDPTRGTIENLVMLLQGVGLSADFSNMELVKNVVSERKVPGTLRFLRSLRPDAVVFCPLIMREVAVAAKVLGVPCVGLNTIAGPGALTTCFYASREELLQDPDEFIAKANAFLPEIEATARMNKHYGLDLKAGVELPVGKSYAISLASLNLVTTCEDLQDPMSKELARAYEAEGTTFVGVGPLLDRDGMQRAAGHRDQAHSMAEPAHGGLGCSDKDLIAKVQAARRASRPVVLVSMGTVITGDMPGMGWEGRKQGADGKPRGLTGRELCQAAWAGAFDAFGEEDAEAGPLLVVSLGPQENPLGDLVAPSNVVCAAVLPQVELLKAGVDLFLTHGGQNSFTESLAHATPVVVCPGFGDQIVNASKALSLGVGLKVDRPDPDVGAEADAAAKYRAQVCQALRTVLQESRFAASAAACSKRLRAAGGVHRAVELILGVTTVPERLVGKAAKLPVPVAQTAVAAAAAEAGA